MAELRDEQAPLLEVRVERGTAGSRVALVGELDMSNAQQILAELRAEVRGELQLTIDLRGLAFIDSAGIAILDRLHHDLLAVGGILRVIAGTSSVAGRTLRLAGMDRVLPLDDDEPMPAGGAES